MIESIGIQYSSSHLAYTVQPFSVDFFIRVKCLYCLSFVRSLMYKFNTLIHDNSSFCKLHLEIKPHTICAFSPGLCLFLCSADFYKPRTQCSRIFQNKRAVYYSKKTSTQFPNCALLKWLQLGCNCYRKKLSSMFLLHLPAERVEMLFGL